MKKGQMSVFIIAGVVILLGIVLVAHLKMTVLQDHSEIEEVQTMPLKTEIFQRYVTDCLEDIGESGVYFNSLQGGYYTVPRPAVNYTYYDIPFYGIEGTYHVPDITLLEKELEKYVMNHIRHCLDQTEIFSRHAYDVTYGNLTVNADINDADVRLEMYYPIIVSNNVNTISMDTFVTTFSSRYKEIHDIAEAYIYEQRLRPDYIRTKYLSSFVHEYGITAQVDEKQENVMIFRLIGTEELPPFHNYTYIFAVKYNWSNEQELYVTKIPDVVMDVGETLNMTVNATGESVLFSDNTPLFDIDKDTGKIHFTAAEADRGIHFITIYVQDAYGKMQQRSFRMEVSDDV